LKLKAIRVKTEFWLPETDYLSEIVEAVRGHVQDGDIITISEKAISTAQGTLIDEAEYDAGRIARFLASFWTRRLWGGPIGKLAKLKDNTLDRLRNYPTAEGAAHKQVALDHVGILQALRHYSEGGIDASNLPFSLVSLPLSVPGDVAERVRIALAEEGFRVTTLIVDGDTTYSRGCLHLAPRRVRVPGLIHFGGFLTFVLGRSMGLKSRSTPIALSGEPMNPDWALTLANVSHRVRGYGAGRTVWDMAMSLGVGLTGVTWEMLESVDHYPIVILRKIT